MLKTEHKQLSLHSILYNRIPENHILKSINNAVDFSFINELLESSYCKYYGRPAKEPEMMTKLLVLEYLYNLSDVKVLEEAAVNLAFMWFLGLNPDDDLPDASLLAKFRTQRLKDHSVDDILKEIIKQCVDKGIVKDISISIDCTHTEANTRKLVPERIMKRLAKRIIKEMEQENKEALLEIDTNIPNYKEIEDHKEAKKVMKEYLEKLISQTEAHVRNNENSRALKEIDMAKEILKDPKFIEQRGIRSLVDQDARVGRKTQTDMFYGYKAEYAMLPKDQIIVSIKAEAGNYTDATNFDDHLKTCLEAGIKVHEVCADKAYFRPSVLDSLEERNINPCIPASAAVLRIDGSKYTYNKDSDQWICMMGHYTIRKKNIKRKGAKGYYYDFDKKDCVGCPMRSECYKGKKKYKTMEVTEIYEKYKKYAVISETEEFKESYKKRASIENKNGEMKRFHGMARARGFGLRSMHLQVGFTAIAVNLKRIAKLISSDLHEILIDLLKNYRLIAKFAVSL